MCCHAFLGLSRAIQGRKPLEMESEWSAVRLVCHLSWLCSKDTSMIACFCITTRDWGFASGAADTQRCNISNQMAQFTRILAKIVPNPSLAVAYPRSSLCTYRQFRLNSKPIRRLGHSSVTVCAGRVRKKLTSSTVMQEKRYDRP